MVTHEIDTGIKQMLTSQQAWFYSAVPLRMNGETLELYIQEDMLSIDVQDELELLLACSISLIPVPESEIIALLSQNYRKGEGHVALAYNLIDGKKDFLNFLISEACVLNSSDIHIEIYEEKARVRFRIDGKLLEKYLIPLSEYSALVNKIKIKANLDISEKRLPQDGRILYEDKEKFDIRVSVLPGIFGEKVVLRLLKKETTDLDIGQLGMTPTQLKIYLRGIKKTHGIVLISGPTGSGKTTTLYGTLKILNKQVSNILTIEDPVEYTLEGINQVQLKEDIGLTFAKALRTFLRQDPDVIMLGEIRDQETAQMALRASLTGHLVLSTVHTNSAWEIVNRLKDMGIPGFLLSGALNLAVAQRLVRLLCPECCKKVPSHSLDLDLRLVKLEDVDEFAVPIGCPSCYYTGYKGRVALYEVIPIDKALGDAIRRDSDLDIEDYMAINNIETMADVARLMLRRGNTSVDEVFPILIS